MPNWLPPCLLIVLTSCGSSVAPAGQAGLAEFSVPFGATSSFEKTLVHAGLVVAGVTVVPGKVELVHDGRTLSVTLAPTEGGTLRVRLAEAPIGLPFDVSLPDGMDIRWDSTGILVGEHRTQPPEPGRYLWDASNASWQPID